MAVASFYGGVLALNQPTESHLDIRLLTLQPAEAYDSPLVGTLSKHTLGQSSPSYTALSYTWGIDPPNSVININSILSLSISPNLASALQEIRCLNASPVNLWIDAICLDQSNNGEKSLQVPQMGRVYAGAQHTLVWLGSGADGSDTAMDWISGLESCPITEDILTAVPDATWTAVRALLRRTWWTRVWVVQEALRARIGPTVLCGNRSVDFANFVILEEIRGNYTRRIPGVRILPSQPFNIMLSMWAMSRRDATSGTCLLFEWLTVTHRFEQKLPRDRFYAMLGMTLEGTTGTLRAEYDERVLSDEQVITRMTMHFLKQYRTLIPLKYCWRKERTGLPSWVPDWCTEQSGWVGLTFVPGEDRVVYNACGPYTHFTPRYEPPVAHGEAPPRALQLIVPGVIIDKIIYADTAPTFDPALEQTPDQEAAGRASRLHGVHAKCLSWRSAVETLFSSESQRPSPYRVKSESAPDTPTTKSTKNQSSTAPEIAEAFWRTIIGDRRSDWTGPPPSSFRRHFDTWMAGDHGMDAAPYYVAAVMRCLSRTFVVTEKGFLGLAPRETRVGDVVCVLQGGDVPFVLRGSGGGGVEEDPWTFLGQAYIHGIMHGEAVAEVVAEEAVVTETIMGETADVGPGDEATETEPIRNMIHFRDFKIR